MTSLIGCHSSTKLDREMKSTPLERTGSPLIGCTISKRSVIGNPYKKPVFWDAHMWGYGVKELNVAHKFYLRALDFEALLYREKD